MGEEELELDCEVRNRLNEECVGRNAVTEGSEKKNINR